MTTSLPNDIEELVAQVAAAPESESALERLLFAYLGHPELHADPRRIGHVRDYVRRFPRELTCRTPIVSVDPDECPDGFRSIAEEWERLLADHPRDPQIVVGAALFIAPLDQARATSILQALLSAEPGLGELWFELGRITTAPRERLEHFKRARALGVDNSNLPAWIGSLAVEVGDFATAEVVALELLTAIDEARSTYGERLDWRERGRALWERAVAACADRTEATELVRAISAHAYAKHWAHTLKGLIATHAGDVSTATTHLHQSAEVVGEPRLSSYGPSMTLASALCALGRWRDVAAYLDACAVFWPDERLREWKEQVEREERPNFPEG